MDLSKRQTIVLKNKVTDIDHDRYITTSEFTNLTAKSFAARLAQTNLIKKRGFDAKLISLNIKINSNKTKRLLVKNKCEKPKIFDSSYFCDKYHFKEDGGQKYLVFLANVQMF